MNLEFYPQDKLKREILAIIKRRLDIDKYRVFFFGSRVGRKNNPVSDIDIGIEGAKEIPSSVKLDIQEELEDLPTLYKFDFVDFRTVSEKFRQEALKNAEYIS